MHELSSKCRLASGEHDSRGKAGNGNANRESWLAKSGSPAESTASTSCICNAGYSGADGGPCTVTPSSGSVTTTSPFDVPVAVSLPLTVAEFDTDKRAAFTAAIAEAAGGSSVDVTIVKVTSISGARRWGEICDARRHLLAACIRVHMSVKAANQNAADALRAKLTFTSVYDKLQHAGFPAATILEAATTALSGDSGSTSDAATSGGMLPAIISVAAGLMVLLAIAFFFYRRYRKTQANSSTAMSDLASAELGMRPPTAPAAHPLDMEAQVRTSSAPAGNLCVHCGTTNEVSSEVCQHCCKL